MIITCKATNIKLNLGGNTRTNLDGLHPLLTLPTKQLNKHYHTNYTKLSAIEAKLLFCAFLYKTELVTYVSPLKLSDISQTMVRNNIQLLVDIANSAKKRNLPKYTTQESANASSFSSYLELLNDANASEWLARPRERKVALPNKVAKKVTKVNHKLLTAQVLDNIEASNDQKRLIEAVLKDFSRFNIPALKQVRSLIADYLPTSTTELREVATSAIRLIEQKIILKADIALALTDSDKEAIAIRQELTDIKAKYTILSGTATTTLDAEAPERKLLKQLSETVPKIVKTTVEVPTKLPLLADYPNKPAYLVAMRKYKEAKGHV